MGLIWFRSFGRPYTGPQRDEGSNPSGSTTIDGILDICVFSLGPEDITHYDLSMSVQNCSHKT